MGYRIKINTLFLFGDKGGLHIIETYMALGGTPYYLDMMSRSLSVAQNIDALFFSENAPLQKEYHFLYKSLFKESRLYRRVVEVLSKQMKGGLVHNAGWQSINNEVDIDDLFHA